MQSGDSDPSERCSIANLSPADLVPLLCKQCGLHLEGGDQAAMFVCTNCGLVHEPVEGGFTAFSPLSATPTTGLPLGDYVQNLAVWRVAVEVKAGAESAWERIKKVAAPEPAYVYVPAFSLARMVVHRLGGSLTQMQPRLELRPGLKASNFVHPQLVGIDDPTIEEYSLGPTFGAISPVLIGRADAHSLAHFVYLAVESSDKHELHAVEYELQATSEDLVFLPAVWDPRQVHESNWRLLLREFDGLVA